ncbi:MAG: hypothetical protein WDN48_05040 [Pseudolabrys sp.]
MCDPHIQDLSGWSMTVADAKGDDVFTLGFDMKPLRTKPSAVSRAAPPPSSPGN